MYKKGDRVHHEAFGLGTVLSAPDEGRIKIKFDSGKTSAIAQSFVRMKKVENDEEIEWVKSQESFPGFLNPEPNVRSNIHAAHWFIFTDEFNQLINHTVPQAMKEARTANGWKEKQEPLYLVPETDIIHHLYNWPAWRQGMMLVIQEKKGQQPTITSFYPFVSDGVQHELKIKRIYPHYGGGEASLETSVSDDMPLVFFDTHYALNKANYGPEMSYQFILAGFAYSCSINTSQPIPISDETRLIFEKAFSIQGFSIPDEIQTKRMTVFVPAEGGGIDDYWYRGPVKEISETKFLDQVVFKIRTTVAQINNEEESRDFDLDIFVAERVLENEKPKIGDEISGILWLQGHLWRPGTDRLK